MTGPKRLRFKSGSLVFRIDGALSKTGEKPPYVLDFTSEEIDQLANSFFAWLDANDLEFGGVFGTEMQEAK